MVREIAVELLHPHPEACNHMPAQTLSRLRRCIAFTGSYEPLVVRPHPYMPGNYQVVHGHHRLRVLRAMGNATVSCLVWRIDDDQARVCIATLNRVSGRDIPERRVVLLEQLLQRMTLEDLAGLVPDRRQVLDEIRWLSRLGTDAPEFAPFAKAEDLPAAVFISCMMEQNGAKSVDLVLDLISEDAGRQISRGEAMAELARRFLHQCFIRQPVTPGGQARSATESHYDARG